MDPLKKNEIANTGVCVTQLSFGGGSLGDPFEVTSDEQAEATIALAYKNGMNYFDTAPWYGNTKSEHRVGHFLRKQERDSFNLNTKVGRIYSRPKNINNFNTSPWMQRWKGGLAFDLRFDYTYDGFMRSYEDSLQRLGMNTVDFLTIHDLDFRHQKNEEGVLHCFNQLDNGGGYKALRELKESGQIKGIGVGVNHIGMIPRFLERFKIDFFLVAMPYTLMDQSALDKEFPLCEEYGTSVVLGAVFCSGILAQKSLSNSKYAYKLADKVIIDKVNNIRNICEGYNVPLGAAAIQFPMGHSVVKTVIPGPNSPEQVQKNKKWFEHDIPYDCWEELKSAGYIRKDAPI
jgi:D-threo-aldose 1-dehydrogenase